MCGRLVLTSDEDKNYNMAIKTGVSELDGNAVGHPVQRRGCTSRYMKVQRTMLYLRLQWLCGGVMKLPSVGYFLGICLRRDLKVSFGWAVMWDP